VAPVSVIFPSHDEGAPGPSLLGTGDGSNLISYSDTVMGSWNFNYDTLNRLAGASDTAPANPTSKRVSTHLSYYCWSYDAFGNRTLSRATPRAK